MSDPAALRKKTLDKDLDKLVLVEEAASFLSIRIVAPGLGLLFLAVSAVIAAFFVAGEPRAIIIIAAAVIGGYMALNIGANDVANNVGPAVGAKALTMGGALALAAVFEIAGALIAGQDVVTTISSEIIHTPSIGSPDTLIRLMLAALIAAALWINLATWIGAPVSTTHSIVGAVVGGGIVAAGISAVNWFTIASITASWVVSPLLGGVIAAMLLAFIKTTIIYQDNKVAAAHRWVPVLVGTMAGAFSAYLGIKALENVLQITALQTLMIGLTSFIVAWAWSRRSIGRLSKEMNNNNQSLRALFTVPLIGSAALLSFGHGANDVSNVVGPLAAIVQAASGDSSSSFAIPLWVMMIGAFGISAGIVLFGPKLVRMVGERITKLNPIRAFCVALATGVTVIVASWFGLPVSSTHIAVGAVFGVGFFREWYTAHSPRRRAYLDRKAERLRGERAEAAERGVRRTERKAARPPISREEIARRKLVRRAHVMTIVTAWVTTVPASALLSAAVFLLLNSLG